MKLLAFIVELDLCLAMTCSSWLPNVTASILARASWTFALMKFTPCLAVNISHKLRVYSDISACSKGQTFVKIFVSISICSPASLPVS